MKTSSLLLTAIALLLPPAALHAQTRYESGLLLPTAEEFAALESEYGFEAPMGGGGSLPARVVNSAHLPPVAAGNQGQVGICGSICITYFTATHQLAKARNWTAPGHNGDWTKVTSPAWGIWAYKHGAKDGKPWGADPLTTIREIMRSGIRSWHDYPYTGAELDFTRIPSFAERADALRWRADSAVVIGDIHSPAGIRSLKYFLAQGNIAATSTPYVPTLTAWAGPNVQNGVVIATGEPETPGHALTIVGYDDTLAYTDPRTGALKYGAYLVVNSWGTDWGYSVPEVGTGGFLWIPYDLPFLDGAYSLHFPAADTVPSLYAAYTVIDTDGDWTSSAVSQARWTDICTLQSRADIAPPVLNAYAAPSDEHTRVLDAADLYDPELPALTLSLLSSAPADTPEGEIRLSLHTAPDDLTPPLLEHTTPVWGSFPYRRTVTISPLTELPLAPTLKVKYGGLASADLNGDGAEELVAAFLEGTADGGVNSGNRRLLLGRNNGAGSFTFEALPGDTEHAGQPLFVDLDNDGDTDIVHASSLRTDLLLNNGAAQFTLSPHTLPAAGAGGVAAADFNRDGHPDLLLANMDQGLLLLRQLPDGSFETRPLGRFTPRNIVTLGVDTTATAAGDVNGDGLPDFVFWEEDPATSVTRLILGLNQGNLTFTFHPLPVPERLQSVSFAFGDFDLDGCDDLAWSGLTYPPDSLNRREARFGILRGSPDGWMQPVPAAPDLPPVAGGHLTWADLNHDGAPDLLLTGRQVDSTLTGPTPEDADKGLYGNRFYFLRYKDGYFVESGFNLTGVTGSHRSALLAPLDMDGDGDLDLFSAGYRGPMSSSSGSDIHEDLYASALYENRFADFALSQSANTAPTAPLSFGTAVSENQVIFTWSGASDAETAPSGLRYILQAGTAPGTGDLLSGTVDPQNTGLLHRSGTRLHDLPAGTLHWRVRTVDPSGALSPWSPGQTLTVPAAQTRLRVRIAPASGGTTTPAPGEHLLAPGASLPLTARPAAGWQFDGWQVNDFLLSTDTSYTLTPSQAWTEVEPLFSEKTTAAPEIGEWVQQIVPYDLWYTFGFMDYAAVTLNGHLYCFPGYGSASQTWRTTDTQNWIRNDFMGQEWFTLPYADAVAWNNHIWLVADATVYRATQAGDGSLTWDTLTTSAPWSSTHMEVIAFNNKLWAIHGTQSASAGSVWSSTDGITWTWEATAPWSNRPYKRLVIADDTLLVITSPSYFGTDPGEVWGSTDGVTWTRHNAAAPWEHDGSNQLSSCYLAAAAFDGAVHVTGRDNTHFVSTDKGVSWVKVHPTGTETSHFSSASAYGSELVVFNNSLYLLGYEEDEVNWQGSIIWRLDPSGSTSGFALNVSVDGTGGTTLPPPGLWYEEAGTYPLEARPDPGYVFDAWTGPVADPAAAVTEITLAGNTAVSARFIPAGSQFASPAGIPLTVTVFPPSSGRVEAAGSPGAPATSVLADGSSELIALPESGWEFSHWIGSAAAEILSARTAVHPGGLPALELTACFRPLRTARVLARADTSGFVDAAGRQWLWGHNRFALPDILWNSPDGGISPFAFNDTDFNQDLTPVYTLGADGTLLQNGALRFTAHRFTQVHSAGSNGQIYTLAIDPAGKAWSWGSNAYGQLGDGTLTDRDAPVPVLLPESETVLHVRAGDTFAMALTLSGKVFVWGANSWGQTGPDGAVNPTPLQMPGLPAVTDIAAGIGHALALGGDGLLYGWGSNVYGQASGRRGNDPDTATPVESLSVSMAAHTVTFRTADPFGNPPGEGTGSLLPDGTRILRAYAEFFVEATDGDRYRFDHWEGPVADPASPASTAKAVNGTVVTAVFALQSGLSPQLRLSMNHPEAAAITPATGTTAFAPGSTVDLFTRPYAGWQFDHWTLDGEIRTDAALTLTLNRDIDVLASYSPQSFRTRAVPGLLNSWGQPATYDSLGRSIINPNYTGPLFVDAVTTSHNSYWKLYLATDGTVWYVDTVPGAMEQVPGETPDIPAFGGVKQIVSGSGGFMLAVRFDDTIWVWGNIPGAPAFVERPVQAAGLSATDFQQITAVKGTLFFLHTNGTLSTWGLNTDLTGTGAAHTALTPVPGLSGIAELAPNPFTILLRKTDGTVWGWGDNYHELLGTAWDSLPASNTPVQVPGISDITRLFSLGFARDSQGRAWVWGRDSGGSKGMGMDFVHTSILPPVLHTGFPANAERVSQPGDGYTYVLETDGSLWRTGNMQFWTFQQLNTNYLISDTYPEAPVHRRLTVQTDTESAAWISHLPGLHTHLDGDRVLLWAAPPVTHQCDGWIIDGLLVSGPAVNLLMDRAHTAVPQFSLRPKTDLPAPELRIGQAVVDINAAHQTVQLPLTLHAQNLVLPEALQFTVHVPAPLPAPGITLPDALRDRVTLITEIHRTESGTDLHLLLLSDPDTLSPDALTLATLDFQLPTLPAGDYPVTLSLTPPALPAAASADSGSVAVPLDTVDGLIQIQSSDRAGVKLVLTTRPSPAGTLSDAAMQTLDDWNALRSDLDRYAEIWVRAGPGEDLHAFAYALSVSGPAELQSHQQYFILESDLNASAAPDLKSITGLGGPLSDEKILSHNDFAPEPYASGEWLLTARIPLGGAAGAGTLTLSDVSVELFTSEGNDILLFPDQVRSLSVAPNQAPTSANLTLSTTSTEFVYIQPPILDANPQDIPRVSLLIRRWPVAGRLILDPLNPQAFIYHPPENGIYSGAVSFEFALSDGTAVSPNYTVDITVNNPPRFVGTPDHIDCGSDTNLEVSLTVQDADTPPSLLEFSLHSAPDWLSIVNNNDGTATLSGSIPPTRDTWQVFSVRAADPLSLATAELTLLLTFDPAQGGVLLTVINGSGGGLYQAGEHIPLAARAPAVDEVFAGWDGDIVHLDDPQSPTPTATLPAEDISLYALFTRLTPAEGFDRWAAAHSLPAPLSGLTDCPMGDGISNLEKYIYGLDPATAYRPADLFQTRYDTGDGRMVLRIETSKNAFGVEITPQACTSLLLQNWNSDSIEAGKVGETATHEIWELALPLGTTPRFMRLQFGLTSP